MRAITTLDGPHAVLMDQMIRHKKAKAETARAFGRSAAVAPHLHSSDGSLSSPMVSLVMAVPTRALRNALLRDAEAALLGLERPVATSKQKQKLAELGVLAIGTPEGDGGAKEIAAAMAALGQAVFPGPLVASFFATQVLPEKQRCAVAAGQAIVSIGVGIDYSIHMTQRFREEMASASTKIEALKRASKGTGLALLASALSSMVGFTIMGLAPFPLISTYGYLTAIMIALALLSSLVVLPSLLLVVTKEKIPHS